MPNPCDTPRPSPTMSGIIRLTSNMKLKVCILRPLKVMRRSGRNSLILTESRSWSAQPTPSAKERIWESRRAWRNWRISERARRVWKCR